MAEIGTIVDAASKAGFQGEDLITAVAVALAESSGNEKANNAGMNSNGTVDYGLWQINSIHGPDLGRVYDPYYNASLAFKVYSDRDHTFAPWVAYDKGSYRRFLDQAREAVGNEAQYGHPTTDVDSAGRPWGTLEQTQEPRSGRLRAESMLATLAQAVASRSQGVDRSSLDPDAELEELSVSSEGDFTERINAVLQSRVEGDELPGGEPVEVPEVAADETGAWQGIPDNLDIQSWLDTGLKENAARGAAIARAFGFGGTIHGVGARGNKSDHPTGNAIDLMTLDDVDTGWTMAKYFLDNRDGLGVKYIIFQDRIASASNGWEWRDYSHPAGRTDPTALHMDHPHISFTGGQ